jgi:mycothiol synthase
MQIRPVEPGADAEAVLAFLQRLEASTGLPALGESKFVDLGGPLGGAGLVVEREEIIAYLHLLWHEPGRVWEMELASQSLAESEIQELVAAGAAEVSGPMLWWTFGESGGAKFAHEQFPLARTLHKLVGVLPPAEPTMVPDGVRVAPFRPGIDEEAWLLANNAAFEGHPENGAWTVTDIVDRQARDWFEADGFRLWWADDRVAGFCWTKRHSRALGEIHVIGVHPDYQGRGLGRSIVIEALWYLAGAGCQTGMLYVDTANQTALELYQSLGFELERIDRCFEIPNGWPHDVQ